VSSDSRFPECDDRGVDRDDILAFARRNWAMLAESKSRYWLDRKRSLSAADLLAIGDQLRRHAMAIHPDWPTDAGRASDLPTHERVTEALPEVELNRWQRSRP
jgi:hypothetical protein